MNDEDRAQDKEAAVADLVPVEMRDRLQALHDLYNHAENITRALEECLQKCNQWQTPSLPTRDA